MNNKYLLLTEFEVRTVKYGSSSRLGHKSTGKKRGSVFYSTDRENDYIISLILEKRNHFKSIAATFE